MEMKEKAKMQRTRIGSLGGGCKRGRSPLSLSLDDPAGSNGSNSHVMLWRLFGKIAWRHAS